MDQSPGFAVLLVFLILLVSLAGCGPALSKSDLGTVVFETPKVSGSDKPYEMPQLGPPLEIDDSRRQFPQY